ncbi:hypothetical protein T459_24595 [Capsicum annuum]|uniref:NB-ARC domain-containing protein n=1 Tax=Capsicum annuum TaxID=4072 RepID=A0A2G2YVL5_CAPAN|nr:hypothetical protein T459_24595 [Capsicum annuum]
MNQCCFDVRAWATVSQQHNIKEILLSLLQSTIKMDDAIKTKGEAELADMLQKSLKRKRYLIVLDDIWSCEVWDGMRRCFPTEDSAGSRILLTTRNNEVARNAGIENLSMQMNFMDQDESWNHFKSAAFSNEVLSSEFETIGKKIAQKCHGLPLTIVVVAGLLKSKGAIEDWESVAKDVTEIPVKNLMRSWMDEGFLKLGNDLEGEAEKCLQELVDRCLVLFCKKSLDGTKIRSCKPFKRVTGDEIDYCPYGLYRELLTPVHRQLRDHDNNDLLKRTHSIFSFHLKDSYFSGLQSELIHFKLLKVLELRDILIDNFPVQILSLIWLRYLSLQCHVNLDIPPEICKLWNLQTFVVQVLPVFIGRSVLITYPEEIWGLMQLRHLKVSKFYLPNPPNVSADKGSHMGFSNIQTISYLSLDCCTNEVILGIQNVKELGINGYEINFNSIWDSGLLNNLVHLQQLETLSFIGCFPLFPASASAFPATLKKLMLRFTLLSWSDLDIIAELPNLELLLIEYNDLKYWKATDDNFPVFERLVLNKCRYLKEIPIEFAEIHTLQLIKLTRCLPELGESATRIQKEQEDLGNNPVDVRISIHSHHTDDEFDDDEDDDDDYDDDDDDDDEENSYVDVAEDNDNDSDADAAERDDN